MAEETRLIVRMNEQLLRRAETVVSRGQLADSVWGSELEPQSNVVEVYIGYLRRKLHAHFPRSLVQTVRGLGYLLQPPNEAR